MLLAGLAGSVTRRRPAVLVAVALGAAGALLWASTGSLPRFLIPTIAMMTAAAVCWTGRLAPVGLGVVLVLTGVGGLRTMGMLRELGGLAAAGRADRVYSAPTAARLVANPYPGFRACEGKASYPRRLASLAGRGWLDKRAASSRDNP